MQRFLRIAGVAGIAAVLVAASVRAGGTACAATITVDTTADTIAADGRCSLREAIQAANTNAAVNECAAGTAGTDTIQFNLGTGTPSIAVTSALPTITEAVVIDGNTGGSTRVELNGAGAGVLVTGLSLLGGNSTVRALVINRFGGNGIDFFTNGGNVVENCYIGTNAAGTADSGNAGIGVRFVCSDNRIGGTTAANRNIISGNDNAGVLIQSGSNNVVEGNYIGTDVTGTAKLGNGFEGVWVYLADHNTIGGTTAGARNVISGNGTRGVFIQSGSNNTVQGNFIGTDVTGTVDVGNTYNGVCIYGGQNNLIGGTTAAARNIISGNDTSGVFITGAASNNLVQGNYIGADVSGTTALPNGLPSPASAGRDGVTIGSTSGTAPNGPASNNTIGGTAAGAANLIAFNTRNGVRVSHTSSTGNALLSNSIFSNTGIGIDLNGDGVTPNGVNPRTFPNNGQNFPVWISFSRTAAGTLVHGTLTSATETSFTLQFFSNPTCSRNGETSLGQLPVTTDNVGHATFNTTLPVHIPQGSSVTATATDAGGNTSEFSACAPQAPAVTGGATVDSTQVSGTATPNGCITIFECGADRRCGTGDDPSLGTGNADSSGFFSITVSPPLAWGQTIYAQDTCNDLGGPAADVAGSRTLAPTLSPAVMGAIAAALGVMGVRLARRQRRR